LPESPRSARSITQPPGKCSPIRAAAAQPCCCGHRRSVRDSAAAILLLLNSRGHLVSGAESDATAEQLELFDTIDEAAARDVLRLWQAHPAYRASVARISTRARPSAEAA
jgi:hypothetical protein